jgi:hypothetical protein
MTDILCEGHKFNYDYECGNCKTKFWAEIYGTGNCPECDTLYFWTEDCTEDYSDCWEYVYWEAKL